MVSYHSFISRCLTEHDQLNLDYLQLTALVFNWGDSYDAKVRFLPKRSATSKKKRAHVSRQKQDWDRLRMIVAPTLLVLSGLCAFGVHMWLTARLDRLPWRDG